MQKKEIVVVGTHAANVAFEHHASDILSVFIEDTSNKQAEWVKRCETANITPMHSKKATLDKLAGNVIHQGIVLKLAYQQLTEADLFDKIEQLDTPPLLLILDGVHDPHNLGACLRSAEAFGATAVIVPSHETVSLTPAVSKSACGAEQLIPLVQVGNLSRFIKALKENHIWVAGLSADATQSLHQIDVTGPLALIMGQEGRGLRQLTQKHCDWLIRIPMQGQTASLNLSASASISLYEVAKQRAS